jgi:hypothetical protein
MQLEHRIKTTLLCAVAAVMCAGMLAATGCATTKPFRRVEDPPPEVITPPPDNPPTRKEGIQSLLQKPAGTYAVKDPETGLTGDVTVTEDEPRPPEYEKCRKLSVDTLLGTKWVIYCLDSQGTWVAVEHS